MNRATKWIGVLGGLVLTGAMTTPATAAGTLDTTASGPITTINYGAAISGNTLDGDLAAATYAVQVASPVTAGKPLFVTVAYAAPTGVSVTAPRLFWRQLNPMSIFPGGPTHGWNALTPGGTAILSHTGWNTFLTADQPGTYKVTIEDRKGTPGTDDDSSATLDVTVLDAYGATGSSLTDDWRPAVTSLSVVGVAKALPRKVDLTALTRVDARGTSSGVGILNKAIAGLVALRTNSTEADALAYDLAWAGVPGNFVSYSNPRKVEADGSENIPASRAGVDVLRHVGSVVTTAAFDRNGTGLFHPSEDLPLAASTTVVARVAGVVTLSAAPAKCTGACKVTLSGTAAEASTVVITGYGSGITVPVTPVTGEFSKTLTVSRTATFQATSAATEGVSDPAKVTVKSVVTKWSAKGGNGKVTVKLTGGPRGGGVCYVKVSGKATVTQQASGSTGSAGTGTCTVTVSGVKKGNRSVKVGYDSPRASISGWTSSRSVKVS